MAGKKKHMAQNSIEEFLSNINKAMKIYQNIYHSELSKQQAIIKKEWDCVLHINRKSNSFFKQVYLLQNTFFKNRAFTFKELDEILTTDTNKKLFNKYQNIKETFETVINNLHAVNQQNTRLLHDSFEINKLKKSVLFNKKQSIPVYKSNGDQEKNLWTKDPYLYDKTI